MYKGLLYQCILYTKGPFVDARDIEQITISKGETWNKAWCNSYTKGPFIHARHVKKNPHRRRETRNNALSVPMTNMKQGSVLLCWSALIVRWDCRLWFCGLFCHKSYFLKRIQHKSLVICKKIVCICQGALRICKKATKSQMCVSHRALAHTQYNSSWYKHRFRSNIPFQHSFALLVAVSWCASFICMSSWHIHRFTSNFLLRHSFALLVAVLKCAFFEDTLLEGVCLFDIFFKIIAGIWMIHVRHVKQSCLTLTFGPVASFYDILCIHITAYWNWFFRSYVP